MTNDMNLSGLHLVGLGELKRNWRWFLGLGVWSRTHEVGN